DAKTPEFFCSMAAVFRLSMDPVGARLWLDKVPAGTGFEDRKRLELAWLELYEGRTDAALDRFRELARDSQERTGALLGTGTALLKKAAADKSPNLAREALEALSSALSRPTPRTPDILACMGEAYALSGDHQQAEDCHRRAMAARPTLRYTIGLGTALLRNGKFREAAHLITGLALIDPGSAGRLAAGLPRDSAAQLLELSRQNPETSVQPGPPDGTSTPPPPPTMLPIGAGAPPPPPSRPRGGGEAAAPPPPPSRRTSPGLEMESLMEAASVSLPTETEVRKDDFMGRAFRLASTLEEETGKKIFFNSEGLVEVEKRLRLVFVKALDERQKHVEAVKDCAAFLCFILQERLHGRLVKMPDFDEWGWPVIFEYPKRITTYPVQRVWKLLWPGDLPEPGWLINYLRYIEEELGSERTDRPHGADAVRGRVSSHAERLTDAQTEHRRIMTLASTLHETSEIEIGRSGVDKLENAIKWNFRPDTPPTKDGWKVLRCYGHILAEILIRDFKAVWYNTEGNDGMWSLLTPWNTFVFPIGKVYKAASLGGGLCGYYDALLSEKIQAAGKPQA
ncbi:MAG TPA: hypothetical protein PL037_05945, partial [Elusimicrobiales bacterium]|nr:hypothetical protein [Elusimicrobiales bacterium]